MRNTHTHTDKQKKEKTHSRQMEEYRGCNDDDNPQTMNNQEGKRKKPNPYTNRERVMIPPLRIQVNNTRNDPLAVFRLVKGPDASTTIKFQLSKTFLDKYARLDPKFGFNGLGETVYYRTYSRPKADGSGMERWHETVERVVNGTMSMAKRWFLSNHMEWNEEEWEDIAYNMYDAIFHMRFLPPGRGLWAMGTSIIEEKGLAAALNNCAFVSTENIAEDVSKPFTFLMDMSMLGVGVGFDTEGKNKIVIRGRREPLQGPSNFRYVIPDSREGWVESVKILIDSYFTHDYGTVIFDYSQIRGEGLPLNTFGGISCGPEPLKKLHAQLRLLLETNTGKYMTSTIITDMMNMIGACVVSGNVRRSAEIAFGSYDDEEFIDLKNYEKNGHRMEYGWASNNSIIAKVGMDYEEASRRTVENGEPGYAWLENMQKYSRMNGVQDNKDYRAKGGNPCLEQTLESYELCCLVETFPNRNKDLDQFLDTLYYAFLYAKIVTLGVIHWEESNEVVERNRRIGVSMSGIAQFLSRYSMQELEQWCETGYKHIQACDEKFSTMFHVPRSIKTTSIKPSGTVSILAGATAGLHFPESRFYVKRLRVSANSPLIEILRESGYPIEKAVVEHNTMIVTFPVDVGPGVRTIKEVTMEEQLQLAAFLQKHWADNQVSCTVSFDKEKEGHLIKDALSRYQHQLKGVSFLPRSFNAPVYPQMPQEAIDETTYLEMVSKLKPFCLKKEEIPSDDSTPDLFCDDNSKCTISPFPVN
jgi:ribonucleoside-triphosphate reductase